ncbi:hypothetical protein CPB83DRAFT_560231 [Crepidotus variabilis]|uniref:DUF7137 domain-containing protein n=1 Tax=Crepidotus variabilis TaxID=179855 RepID=A0A9P6EA03_9AGAR|nr:hypothetical protein CPB83DRAFT_560231 [Crepidotus variabilis]
MSQAGGGNGNGNGNGNGGNGGNGGNSNSVTGSASSTTSSKPSITLIPNSLPAGGLTITQPPQTAVSYFKIAPSQAITFAWTMTSVIATPTHLTVSAVCDNGNTYAVGPTDGIIPGTATGVVWDIYSYQQNNPNRPLAQATYTLHVWDDRGPGSARKAGYLQENNQLKFAMYTPQPYTPISSGWSCAACNGASSFTAHPAFISLIVTFFLIFFSGFQLLRTAGRGRD